MSGEAWKTIALTLGASCVLLALGLLAVVLGIRDVDCHELLPAIKPAPEQSAEG